MLLRELEPPTRLAAGNRGASQLPDSSLCPCHALGPRQALGLLTFIGGSVSASPVVHPVATCSHFLFTRLYCFRKMRPSLRPGQCPVHASPVLFARAPYHCSLVVNFQSTGAGPGTSDRLHLARRGLAPRQKSQTSLAHIKVDQPVARLPPHRSRRAVFPHRALQNCSLPHLSGNP